MCFFFIVEVLYLRFRFWGREFGWFGSGFVFNFWVREGRISWKLRDYEKREWKLSGCIKNGRVRVWSGSGGRGVFIIFYC